MNLMKKQLILITAAAVGVLVSINAQTNIDLSFTGMLADIQNNRISNEQFDLSLKLLTETGDLLWEDKSAVETDEEGWFDYSIREISRFLMKDEQIRKTIVIRMEFLPNANTSWMRKGDDFMVSYTLKPMLINNSIQIEMTRMEGSELTEYTDDHLSAFIDQYPFAYLTGGFLLTDKPPMDKNSKEDLKQLISPNPDVEDGAGSRGVKGGFPAGGYRKKN